MITFAYPYGSPTNTLSVKNPDLGESFQLNIKTMFQQDMTGVVHSYKRTPTNVKLLLRFRLLTKSKVDEFRVFYIESIGQNIKYTDVNSDIWSGKFVNDTLEIITIKDTCSYNIAVEFQGNKI